MVVGLFIVGAQSPAGAASFYVSVGSTNGTWVTGGWDEPDSQWRVRDEAADGHSGVVQWRVGSMTDAAHSLWDHDGADNGWESVTQIYSIRTRLYFRACTGEYSTKALITCSPWTSTVTG